jgi:putative glutamine amidotransferase
VADGPVVGICAAVERVSWGSWSAVEANLSPRVYALAVQRAGALALILPPDDAVARNPSRALDLLDALLLAGGSDVGAHAGRDRFELALARRALERDMPVLGVCRGMEVLNVALGGTLVQDIERVDLHRHTPGAFSDHAVRLRPGSLAARAVGAERTLVKSHHHQALDELGEGLEVSGWSEPDGLAEAIELPERSFALGVLWHPEEDEQSRVVGALLEAA